jgi:hypothetical protein
MEDPEDLLSPLLLCGSGSLRWHFETRPH